jgi:hypothetical protein
MRSRISPAAAQKKDRGKRSRKTEHPAKVPELHNTENEISLPLSRNSRLPEDPYGSLANPRIPRAQRQAAAAALASQGGNLALQRLLTSMERAKRAPEDVISKEATTILRQEEKGRQPASSIRQKLLDLNIKEEEIGTPETLGQPELYLQKLQNLIAKHPGIAGVLIRRWNNRSDDLGHPKGKKEYKPYASVLHYLEKLDELAEKSLETPGMTWENAIRILSSPKNEISLAGARFTVHPRALYFTAAAQVGMDIAAKKEAGRGHYIAPGALYSEVYSINEAASTVVSMSARGPAEGKPGNVLPMANSKAIYDNLRERLANIEKYVAAQQKAQSAKSGEGSAGVEALAEYHQEPVLVAFFAKREALKALAGSASSDADAVGKCQQVMEILKLESGETKPKSGKKKKKGKESAPGETLPKKVAGHGTWSFDPHGTPHGLAVAIDLFTDRVRAVTNMGAPPAAKSFLNYLIRQFGAAYGLNTEKGYRGMNMGMARLLRDEGKDTLTDIAEMSKSVDRKKIGKTINEFDVVKNQLRSAYQKRSAVINAMLKKRKWQAPADYKAQLTNLRALLSPKEIGSLLRCSPIVLVSRVMEINKLLEDAASRFPVPKGEPGANTPAQQLYEQMGAVRTEAEPSLVKLLEGLSSAQIRTENAISDKEMLEVKKKLSPSVKKWVTTVSNLASSAFDQPAEVVAGITGVKGARLMGPHHWEIGTYQVPKGEVKPGAKLSYSYRDLLTSKTDYKDLLLADMNSRSPEVMERILKTMGESPGGRSAVSGEGGDATFKEALNQWSATKKVDLATLLKTVKSVEPTAKRRNPKLTKLIQDLYSRGYSELAKQLESLPQLSANPEAAKEGM